MTKPETIGAAGLLLACGLLAAAATSVGEDKLPQGAKAAPGKTAVADKAVLLDIPETGQELRRPPSGWCGEASVQMAMSYYGAYASQRTINRAGKPAHPDLYEDEVPTALTSLGLESKGSWHSGGLGEFMAWVRAQLAAGHPVVLGTKVNPTANPDWKVDHIVLAVGCTKETLTYNTTWKRGETKSDAALASQKKGISIANPFNIYFGCAVTGIDVKATPAGARPTRVTIVRKGEKQVELHVTAENLQPGKRYRLVKFTDLAEALKPRTEGEVVKSFVAGDKKPEFVETVGLDDSRVYRCLPESGGAPRKAAVQGISK